MTTVKENSMDSCQDPVSFIIDSFLERPEEWDFGSFESSFDANYATHKKSGFKLKLYQYHSRSETPPIICEPDWAYKYKFTKEEKRLLMAAIQPVREAAITKAKKRLLIKLFAILILQKNQNKSQRPLRNIGLSSLLLEF